MLNDPKTSILVRHREAIWSYMLAGLLIKNEGDNDMHNVTIQEAEGHLAELAQLAAQGQKVVIRCKDGSLIKLVSEKPAPRKFGQYEGQIQMSDDFDDELPESYWLGNGDK